LSEAMARAVKDLGDVMLYALSNSIMMSVAKKQGVRVAGEVFADRGYAEDGTLAPRGQPGAMIEEAAVAVERALVMVEKGYVVALSGKPVPVSADTLCLHGDQPGAVAFAQAIRQAFSAQGIGVAAP
jgi:5-oxoprolinase (ATP-hydrolysing) subunit A